MWTHSEKHEFKWAFWVVEDLKAACQSCVESHDAMNINERWK